jgi:hypothetical protein
MLTEKKLLEMKPNGIIGNGTGTYPEVYNGEIRWVALRGEGMHDWCIYYGYPQMSIEEIARMGDKMFTRSVIERLVPCDEDAWSLYRF